jgi:hypothetical protein
MKCMHACMVGTLCPAGTARVANLALAQLPHRQIPHQCHPIATPPAPLVTAHPGAAHCPRILQQLAQHNYSTLPRSASTAQSHVHTTVKGDQHHSATASATTSVHHPFLQPHLIASAWPPSGVACAAKASTCPGCRGVHGCCCSSARCSSVGLTSANSLSMDGATAAIPVNKDKTKTVEWECTAPPGKRGHN